MNEYCATIIADDLLSFFSLRYCSNIGPSNVVIDSTCVVVVFTNYPLEEGTDGAGGADGAEFSLNVFIGKRISPRI